MYLGGTFSVVLMYNVCTCLYNVCTRLYNVCTCTTYVHVYTLYVHVYTLYVHVYTQFTTLTSCLKHHRDADVPQPSYARDNEDGGSPCPEDGDFFVGRMVIWASVTLQQQMAGVAAMCMR